MSFHVVPTPLVSIPPNIHGFNLVVKSFQLNREITFNVVLFDSAGTPLQVKEVCISGDDYQAWGNDDSYVENYICNALGLTPLTNTGISDAVEEPVVEEPVVEEPAVEEPAVEEPSA